MTPTATPVSRSGVTAQATTGRKPLSGQRFSKPLTLASALLLVGITMGGCLVPQDYRFSDDPPPFKNDPVKIVAPDPTKTTVTTYNGLPGGTPCSVHFEVSASDPDLNDPITVQWFVDYDEVNNPGIYREELLINKGSPVRGPALLDVNLDAPGNPLASQGLHVLEVLVSDGQLVNRVALPKSEDPDAGENPSYVDRWVWIVNTQPGTCPVSP